MTGSQQDHRNLSLILSDVLSDIGVNDEMVMRRRNGTLLRESLFDVNRVMENSGEHYYFFGSQSEGTTTLGLNSDADGLISCYSYLVIQDWAHWKPNVTNLLMVQDDTTAPGYCLLQLLRNDAPLPVTYVPDNEYYKDGKGRIVLKNTKYHHIGDDLGTYERHGPALSRPANEYSNEMDFVPSFHCDSWPTQGRHWLHRRSVSGWPTMELKTVSEKSGCFLVPIGSKINGLNELEWRISTSHAERYLMFSLNITQLRCYVLMKMLLKSHISRGCANVISSYMCKTAVLHCVEKTNSVFWQDHNLLPCLNQIVHELHNYVLNINCPHIIIPENNLMAERISPEQKQRLLENIQHIIYSNGRVLFEIQTDDFGARLQIKLKIVREIPGSLPSVVSIRRNISGMIIYHAAATSFTIHSRILCINDDDNMQVVLQHLLCIFDRCKQHYAVSNHLEQEAYTLLLPLLCSTIGSLMATFDITLNRQLSCIALEWFKLGVNSDVSSGWLKLATVYYTTGDMNSTAVILHHVDQRYDRDDVLPACGCRIDKVAIRVHGFHTVADQIQNNDIGRFVSYCLIFMRCEGDVVPHEMRQEYSRSTQEDIRCRSVRDMRWMNFAVVDSLPYLYFLQYKTYGCLRNRGEQEMALHKLRDVTYFERNLSHKETALNLLGQCMEQENLPNEAFNCYEQSLIVRPRNNAAQFHRARMLP